MMLGCAVSDTGKFGVLDGEWNIHGPSVSLEIAKLFIGALAALSADEFG